MWRTLNLSDSYDSKISKDLEAFVMPTLPAREGLKKKCFCSFSSPIVHVFVKFTDKPDNDCMFACYASKIQWLKPYVEKVESRVKRQRGELLWTLG